MKFLFAVCLSAAFLIFTGCASLPDSVVLSEKDNGQIVHLPEGGTVTIELPGNPSTGYMWVLKGTYDEAVVIMTGDFMEKPDTSKVGVPVKKIVKFKAVGNGTAGITYEYRRPWESNKAPEKTFEILINVNSAK